MSETFYITKPYRGEASSETIMGWYDGAVASGAIDDTNPQDEFDAANALEDAGIITVEHTGGLTIVDPEEEDAELDEAIADSELESIDFGDPYTDEDYEREVGA
jgi:hypothetical protein